MGEFASKGVAGTGLGLGIAGTALGVLNNNGNGSGLLAGLFGNNNCMNDKLAMQSEISQLKAEKYSDKIGKEVYERLSDRLIDKYISPMAVEIADSRVREAKIEEQIKCMGEKAELREQLTNARINEVALVANNGITALGGQIACLQATVSGITKTIVPATAVCPAPMPLYNSWTTPTAPTP